MFAETILNPTWEHEGTPVVSVREFEYDDNLGRELTVAAAVKWTNQRYHDSNFRAKFGGNWDPIRGISKENITTHRNQYYEGLLVVTTLDTDLLKTSTAEYTEHFVQPTSLVQQMGQWVIGAGSRVYVREELDDRSEQRIIRNPWFARIHSAELSNQDPERVIVCSSALDYLLEIDKKEEVSWQYDFWQAGLNVNSGGHHLTKTAPKYKPHNLNPSSDFLCAQNKDPAVESVVGDPEEYGGLGLKSYATAVYPNSMTQHEGALLITSLRLGTAMRLDRNSLKLDIVLKGLDSPHGFRKTDEGFILSDTAKENFLMMDEDMMPTIKYSFIEFDDHKPGLEKAAWLQDTLSLGNNIYAVISSVRQKLTLVDISNQRYRDIDIDPDWGLQTIVKITNQESKRNAY